VDQGRQAGGEDDTAELPSVPVQRRAALAERDRLQPGEPVAAAGAAQEDRRLVVDQLAAAVSEVGWPIDQARSLLLAGPGGESSDAATVRQHAGADSWAVPSGRIAAAVGNREIDPALPGGEKCLRYRLPRAADSGSGGFICQSVQFDSDTIQRECYNSCSGSPNEEFLSVATSTGLPKWKFRIITVGNSQGTIGTSLRKNDTNPPTLSAAYGGQYFAITGWSGGSFGGHTKALPSGEYRAMAPLQVRSHDQTGGPGSLQAAGGR
jgi:hypothetical protein